MRDVNWWLMTLSFLLGLVLTLALTIRKVTREVPVTHTVAATVAAPVVKAPEVRKVAGAATAAVATGYTIKGDKDTGRYFSPGSPDYEAIEAEVWFANEASAEKAGFLRWDAKAGTHPVDPGADAAKTIVTGGTTTPDSATVVVSGGTTIPAGTSAVVHEGSAIPSSAAMIVSESDPTDPDSTLVITDESGPVS